MGVAVLEQTDQATVIAELVALYAGCDLTDGHPTVPLALAIIRQARPDTLGDLRRLVYGDWAPGEIPERGADILAYAWSYAAGKPYS